MERITKENYENIVYVSCNWDKEYTEKILYDLRQKYPTYLFISPVHAAYGVDDEYSIQSGLFMLDALADEMWYADRKHSGDILSREIEYCKECNIPMKKISEMLEKDVVILYSSENCPMCTALKNMLDEAKVAYTICYDKETMLSMGFTSIPMLKVNENIINYKNAIKWIKEREMQ